MNTRLKIIIAIIAISISGRAYTQGDTIVWHQETPFPSTPRESCGYFLIDSNFYVVGGIDGNLNFYKEVWKYNINSNQWQQMDTFLGGIVGETTGFTLNGKGYICTGLFVDSFQNFSCATDFWEYTPDSDAWVRKADFPGTPREWASEFTYNNKAYFGLGDYCSNPLRDLWMYDPVNDQWTAMDSFPSSGRTSISASIVDSFAYIIGGVLFNDIWTSENWRYNISANKWEQKKSIPGPGRSGTLNYSFGNFILVGYGGIGYNSWDSTVLVYDSKNDSWRNVVSLNFVDAIAYGGTFQIGNIGYNWGGDYAPLPSPDYANMWSFDATPLLSYTGINTVTAGEDFKVYPNPASYENGFSISTSESGSVLFYDALGRTLDERKLLDGLNQIKLTTIDEVIFYHAILSSGAAENGKMVFIR